MCPDDVTRTALGVLPFSYFAIMDRSSLVVYIFLYLPSHGQYEAERGLESFDGQSVKYS